MLDPIHKFDCNSFGRTNRIDSHIGCNPDSFDRIDYRSILADHILDHSTLQELTLASFVRD